MCSLSRLYRRCNLGVRGRKQAGDLFGQRLIGAQAGELALPEVEETPGQAVEIGRVVVFGGTSSLAPTVRSKSPVSSFSGAMTHYSPSTMTIARRTLLSHAQTVSCRTAVSALR